MVIADAKQGVELERIESIINEELNKLLADGPTPEELNRTRFSTMASFVRQAEKVGGFGGKSDILRQACITAIWLLRPRNGLG